MSLSNADFRRIVESTPRPPRYIPPSPSSQDVYVPEGSKKKKRSSTNKKDRKFPFKKKDKTPSKKKKKKGDKDEKEEEEEEKKKIVYRDRAKEMREGKNPDYQDPVNAANYQSMPMEATKYLGGVTAFTHLVKGLDYVLLRRNRGDISQDQAKLDLAKKEKKRAKEKALPRKKAHFKSYVGRRAHEILFSRNNDDDRTLQTFLPGRMVFEFDLDPRDTKNLPTIMHRSKGDCPTYEETVSGKANKQIMRSLGKIMHSLRSGKKRSKRHLKQMAKQPEKKAKSSSEVLDAAAKGNISILNADDEDDIFEGAGTYVFQPKPKAESSSSHSRKTRGGTEGSGGHHGHSGGSYGEDHHHQDRNKRLFLDGRHFRDRSGRDYHRGDVRSSAADYHRGGEHYPEQHPAAGAGGSHRERDYRDRDRDYERRKYAERKERDRREYVRPDRLDSNRRLDRDGDVQMTDVRQDGIYKQPNKDLLTPTSSRTPRSTVPQLGTAAQIGLSFQEKAMLKEIFQKKKDKLARLEEGKGEEIEETEETEETEDPFDLASFATDEHYGLSMRVSTGYDMLEDSDDDEEREESAKTKKRRKMQNPPSKAALQRMEKRKLQNEWKSVTSMMSKK